MRELMCEAKSFDVFALLSDLGKGIAKVNAWLCPCLHLL